MKMGVMKDALREAWRAPTWCSATATASAGMRSGAARSRQVKSFESRRTAQALSRECRPGDHVLVMSNGGFGGIHAKLLEALGVISKKISPQRHRGRQLQKLFMCRRHH